MSEDLRRDVDLGREPSIERVYRLWLFERNLLAQRLMVFLLFHSILFLSFATLLKNDKLALGIGSAGALLSILASAYLWHPNRRLRRLQKRIGSQSQELLGLSEDEYKDLHFGGVRGHELVTIGIPVILLCLWLLGLASVVCRLLCH